eukprot:8405798-Alexandrium_andersonii.AAC.1
MSASLVGSEMCIRDSHEAASSNAQQRRAAPTKFEQLRETSRRSDRLRATCLLYTSDAADDM